MADNDRSRLVLREAAGCYWLVDTGQSGRPYRPPLRLNETGAEIWRGISDGRAPEEIAAEMAEGSGVPADEVLADVTGFIDQLNTELAKRDVK